MSRNWTLFYWKANRQRNALYAGRDSEGEKESIQ